MADEKRLIDANALITKIQGTASEVAKNAPYVPEWFTRLAARQFEILNLIDDMPTVDAVEVVRCKDCKKAVRHEVFPWSRRCKMEDCKFSHKETHFCSYGERKDNERKTD